MSRPVHGSCRIIGGEWRSRRLPVLERPGLRPTPDRVRETLFNWLQQRIPGSRCLDLFAGSGVLGFEAASRGAAEVVMVEKQADVFRQLQSNIALLGSQTIHPLHQDALAFLATDASQFDVIFVDPPYDSDLLQQCLPLLPQHLASGGRVYLELPANQELPELPGNLQRIRGKKAGLVGYYLAANDEQDRH